MMIKTAKKYGFLFRKLVQRDFIRKYKKTTLGVIWSILSPLCEFLTLKFIFEDVYGRDSDHYGIYILCGILVFSFYRESTNSGMTALLANAGILQKIKLPSWIFPLSKNVSSCINFLIECSLLCVFCIVEKTPLSWNLLALIFPMVMMMIGFFGFSMLLATLYVFFKDTQYIMSIFNRLLYFCSGVFWTVDRLPEPYNKLLIYNPMYDFIRYFRSVIIDATIPTLQVHLILAAYSFGFLIIGLIVYSCNRNKFVFYL